MERRLLQIGNLSLPAMVARPVTGSPARGENPLVILLHGLGAAKEVQAKERRWLAEAGFTAVTIDAPHHGERGGPLLDAIERESDARRRHALVIELVSQAAAEIPQLITFFRRQGHGRIAVAGISLGGYTAFGAILHEPLPDALVPLLASPDWNVPSSPHLHLERFAKLPTLAVVAGKDEVVPPGPCRALFAALSEKYKKRAADRQLLEYPESGHFMREEDWNDAWRRIVEFLESKIGDRPEWCLD